MTKRRKLKRCFSVWLAGICLLLAVCPAMAANIPQAAASSNRKTVRVGFPIQKNMTEKTKDGGYTGYCVDYLNELVNYTDWEIEYVEVEGDINTQLTTLGEMLETGEIDMLGTMNMNEYLQELYLYPTYSYGNTYTALTVAEDSTRWQSADFQNWNGMRVASYPGLVRRMEQLEQYAQMSGFTYEVVEYESLDAVQDAVINGEADACLQVDINVHEGLRLIARFNPSPYYFALNKERTDLQKELNVAMYNLMEAYPSLQGELYSRYFLKKDRFYLSEENHAWVESLVPLRVLYFKGNMPVQSEESGEPSGVAATFMQAFCEATGLQTEPVFAENYEEALQLIEEEAIDLIVAMPGTSVLNADARIRLTHPYFESSAVRVSRGNPEVDRETRHLMSANVEAEMNMIKHNQKNTMLLDAYCVSHYMRKSMVYDSLYVEWADRENILYSVGVLPSVEDRLVGILNSFIGSLSEQTKQTMLYENSRAPVQYTAAEWVEVYRWQFMLVLITLLVLVLVLSHRKHNQVIHENEAEVERLHQFSIIINECLIKYDAHQDRLIMQNNSVVFPDVDVLHPFLEKGAQTEFQNENDRRYAERLREMLRNRIGSSELELDQDGAPRWFRIDLAYVENEYAVGRLTDINDEVERRTLLEHKASHDALTGMMNRSAVQHRVDDYLSANDKGIFLLLDLDNFKKVNDTKGHSEGDKVLQTFAAFLQIAFREEDYKARLGGDEFVVFMPVQMREESLQSKLERVLKEAVGQVFADYHSCELSVSIGAAYVSERFQSFRELYEAADRAMYVAKYGGKNNYFISEDTICEKEDCTGCEEPCKKREYLVARGVTDPKVWNGSSADAIPGRR